MVVVVVVEEADVPSEAFFEDNGVIVEVQRLCLSASEVSYKVQ